MDEVERVPGQLVGDEVQLADLEAGRRLLQQAHVEVDGDHAAGSPTRRASQRANEPPPAPASRQCQPCADAQRLRGRMLAGS